MTSLESFLSGNKKPKNNDVVISEPASGSFQCQDIDCSETVHEGFIDRVHSRVHWVCSQGHESSVVI